MKAKPQPSVLSLKEFAAELRISEHLARGWIKAGKVNAANLALGKRPFWRIRRAELDRVLAEGLTQEKR